MLSPLSFTSKAALLWSYLAGLCKYRLPLGGRQRAGTGASLWPHSSQRCKLRHTQGATLGPSGMLHLAAPPDALGRSAPGSGHYRCPRCLGHISLLLLAAPAPSPSPC